MIDKFYIANKYLNHFNIILYDKKLKDYLQIFEDQKIKIDENNVFFVNSFVTLQKICGILLIQKNELVEYFSFSINDITKFYFENNNDENEKEKNKLYNVKYLFLYGVEIFEHKYLNNSIQELIEKRYMKRLYTTILLHSKKELDKYFSFLGDRFKVYNLNNIFCSSNVDKKNEIF